MSKHPPPAPTASAIGPCPTFIQLVGRPGTESLPSTFAPPDHPPDALGNKANVNVTEDEHAILFTGCNKDEIARLGVDARNCAVLDSACSSTVCS